jgi:hypothetical protein
MAITAHSGPQINFGVTLSSSGAQMDYNSERGPSLFDLGTGISDPRTPFCYGPGSAVGTDVMAWPGSYGGGVLVDGWPTAISTNGLALTQTATSFSTSTLTPAALTLIALTSQTQNATWTTIVPTTGTTAVSVLALDLVQGAASSTPVSGATPTISTRLPFGVSGTVNFWNPQGMISRNVQFCNNSSQDLITTLCKISGYDVYGYAMSEIIPFSTSGSATSAGKKAFKYIASAVVYSTGGAIVSSLVSLGAGDVYGFPIRLDSPAYTRVYYGPSATPTPVGSSGTAFTIASTVATATSTTGDVRGTLTASGASNATQASSTTSNRLTIFVLPSPVALATITSTNSWGFVGYPQA